MTSHTRSTAGDATAAFVSWLVTGAVGPALVALPVNLVAGKLAGAAVRWFKRFRKADDLSRLVKAAAGTSVDLGDAEFKALRKLLEKEQTWSLLAGGQLNEKVQELTGRIAERLPPRDGRTAEDAGAAAEAIARGLLEFAVFDLQPEIFQRVVLARLQQMSGQASALDEAMAAMHADLAALAVYQDVAEAGRFTRLMGQLGRVLDRLPGPAGRAEVAVYLAVMIRWLNTDPWLQDGRAGGTALVPASVERKLAVAGEGGRGEQVADADELARECERLVVLGGPGSGKTWLARRTARLCAEAALHRLAAGKTPDEVELPLFTTCARLAAAPGDVIRRAVVSSALGQLPDLGGARLTDAVRMLFEERDAPTLLVADSLDEAHGADERIRLADWLPASWRIVLTSRPASWHGQLSMGDAVLARRVGSLRPLRYPDDVEPVIARWLSGKPARAAGLSAQLRDRPPLQQSATVPLILAFYCIVGGDQPLPGHHAELYDKVIRRMLAGRWRGSGDRDLDPEACLDTLRDWACSASAANPVSGTGAWADEFGTPRAKNRSRDERDALDHVAVPMGPADDETGMTPRRFVHRAIREHLVAEHIAQKMPAKKAAAELINHLWYDPDWEYAAPGALVRHPQRDQVLQELIRWVTGSDKLPQDLAPIDSCWEIRRFLARVAQESAEADWSAEAAGLIGQARLDLATSRLENIGEVMASDWPTSNRLIRRSLLALLTGAPATMARIPTAAIAGLDPAPKEQAQAREALLRLLPGETRPAVAVELAEALTLLDPPAEDRAQTCGKLLSLLIGATDPREARDVAEPLTQLTVTAEDRARVREALLAALTPQPWLRQEVTDTVTRLTVTAEERAQVREQAFALLTDKIRPRLISVVMAVITRLAVTAEDRAQTRRALLELLAGETNPATASTLAEAVAGLDPEAEERAPAREPLLALLDREADPWMARRLAEAAAGLDPSVEDRARIRGNLLGLFAGETAPRRAGNLAEVMVQLTVTAEDRAQAREALLRLLQSETIPWMVRRLTGALARLAVTAEDRAQTRGALLELLAGETNSATALTLAEAVARLDASAQDHARVREELIGRLNLETDREKAQDLAEAVVRITVTAEDRARARDAMLRLLPKAKSWRLIRAVVGLAPTAEERTLLRKTLLRILADETNSATGLALAEAVATLDPATQERTRTREALLRLLDTEADPWAATELAGAVATLDPTAEDRARGREALLAHLADETLHATAQYLVEAVARLTVTAEDREQVRERLLGLLGAKNDPWVDVELAEAVAGLDPAAQDQTRLRQALLALLVSETSRWRAEKLAEAIAALHPTVADLGDSVSWLVPPTPTLLAAVRRNSELAAWLAALPVP